MPDHDPPSDEPRPEPEELFQRFLDEHDDPTSQALSGLFEAHPDLAPDLRRLAEDRLEGQKALEVLAGFSPGPAVAQRDEIAGYRLVRLLGRGGQGEVWEADDSSLDRRIALKLIRSHRIDERSLNMFAREARAGGRLQHSGLVTVHGHGEDDGHHWIALELIPGGRTVRDWIVERAQVALPDPDHDRRAAEFLAELAEAMEVAHQAGVIHRDLKPQNVLVTPEGKPKVTDFGLARIAEESALSETGQILGTWLYMSPEQVRAERSKIDHRTDVFSLGVLMYELLALQRPFTGDTTQQIAQRILTWDPPELRQIRSRVPRDLAVICAKAMEKSPDQRYATMAELAADLRRHLAHEPIVAKPPGPVARGLKWMRRHPAVSSAGAIASVALGVVSALSLSLAARTRELRKTNEDLGAQTRLAEAQEALLELQPKVRMASEMASERTLTRRLNLRLRALVAEAESLWPPEPELLPRYERWLADARALLDGRSADACPSLADHEAKLAELEARAVPETDEARLAAARDHASHPALERARAELTWRRRMLGHEEWPDLAAVEAALEGDELPSKPAELVAVARPLVGPDVADLGQVTRGRALAGRALAAAAGADAAPFARMTLAWAEARRGEAAAAREAMERALEEQDAADAERSEEAARPDSAPGDHASSANGDERAASEADEESAALRALKEDAAALEAFLARWEEDALPVRQAELQEQERRILRLEIEVGERVFPDPEDASWQRQLKALVRGIRALHDPATGLVGDTLAAPFGWGVAKRAEFAAEIEQRSVTGDAAAKRWEEAIAQIAASKRYGGLELTPQMGLLPIGPDPESELWEFAHLATGEPAVRGEDGALVLAEETGLVLVLIPGGTFSMGAQGENPDGQNFDERARPDESPVHQVTLSPYFLSKYEMTQGQWLRATAVNPSYCVGAFGGDLRSPVEQVSWLDCMEVTYRLAIELPSEAQWENGCRAGTDTPWWLGAGEESLRRKVDIADMTAPKVPAPWTAIQDRPHHEDGGVVHRLVGSYTANEYGLHEVHGNVSEWCRDGYDGSAYLAEGQTDPVVPPTGSAHRVYRGGSFRDTAGFVRSANRSFFSPKNRALDLGLRPARGITADDITTSPDGTR